MNILNKLFKTSKRIIGYEGHRNNIGIIKDSYQTTKEAIQNKGALTAEYCSVDALNQHETKKCLTAAKRFCAFFIFLAVLGLINALYLLVHVQVMPTIFCLAFTFFCAAQIFKYQISIFQLKNPNEQKPIEAFKAQLFKRKQS